MNREEFLSACSKSKVSYRVPLLDFYKNYADIVDKIYDKYVRNFHEQGGMTLKGKLMLTIPVSLLLLFMFIIIESPIMRCVIIIMWVTKVIFFTKMKTIKIEEV